MAKIVSLVMRDILLEWRNKSALGGTLIYLITVVFICLHAFEALAPDAWIALFWIVTIFTIMNIAGRSFDTETGKAYGYHYHLIKPNHLILSKLILNAISSILVGVVAYLLFSIFLGNDILHKDQFFVALILGCAAIGCSLSLMAAITARTDGNLVLMAVLSLPVLLPIVLLLVQLTARTLGGYTWNQQLPLILALVGIIFILVILSVVLFPYLWRD